MMNQNQNNNNNNNNDQQPSINLFEFDHAYLIEIHIAGIQENSVKLTFTEGGKALYLTCKIPRKMFYAADYAHERNLTTHKYMPWVFKRRIEFQRVPVVEDEVVAKCAADGLFVIMAPKKIAGGASAGVEDGQ